MSTTDTNRAIGRRKTASARVRLTSGKGTITVNGKDFKVYFPHKLQQQTILEPLQVAGKDGALDVSVKVAGGGINGQCEAVRHGISRALVELNEQNKPLLKVKGFLTRDSRSKERKKFGRRRARRGHQWRKR
ncbi:30S ribosomal protein S9 [Candidatus Nomurabacteria bacterium]|nr:30S ribosomal protein S9 [Candidatus Nomurabacteria bacterium]